MSRFQPFIHAAIAIVIIAAVSVLIGVGKVTAAEGLPLIALAGGVSAGIASGQTNASSS